MSRIVCIMGPSSTGKDTIYKKILARKDIELEPIVLYTTRPIRAGESDGVEYHFTDEAGFLKLREEGRIVEDRAYQTVQGLWRYFTVAKEDWLTGNGCYAMIGTLESYEKLKEYLGREKMVPILITLEDGERLQRALDRERGQEKPQYQELCRRFLADQQDFSEEKIAHAGITRRFVNEDSDKCVEEICTYLKNLQGDF